MGRNSYYVSKMNETDRNIARKSELDPINEQAYSKELFMLGREQALLDCGIIKEEQRIHFETSYPGDIKNSVNYLKGYKRGIEISKTPHLPDEYKTNKLHR